MSLVPTHTPTRHLVAGLSLALLPYLVSIAHASTFGPTVLVNTEALTTIDQGDGSTNVQLRFGDGIAEELTWSPTLSRFEFSDDLHVQVNLTASGTLVVEGSAATNADLTLNSDNGAVNAVLTFGNDTLPETLTFERTNSRFAFSDDVHVLNNLTGSGTLRIEGNAATKADLFLNADNGATNAVLSFGNDTVAETLTFNDTTARFELSDDLQITDTLSASGAVAFDGLTTINANLEVIGTVSGSTLRADNFTTSGGVLYALNTTMLTETAAGSSGQVLVSQGGKTPMWEARAKKFFVPNPLVTISNSAAETSVLSVSIPADTLGTAGGVKVSIYGRYVNNTGANRTFTARVKFGSTTLFADTTANLATSATARPVAFEMGLLNKNATNAQGLGGTMTVSNSTAGANGFGDLATDEIIAQTAISGTSAENTTAARTFDVTMQLSNASAAHTFTVDYALLELWE